MGSQSSKGEVSTEAAAADVLTVKTNGQENGHMKKNGDVSTKPDRDAVAMNGSAETAGEPEAGSGGDAIEPAPPADKEAAGPEGRTAVKETLKKKKKFSLKKTFKLKLNLKKSKKSEAITEEAAATASEVKPAEGGAATEEEKKEESKEEEEAAHSARPPESAEQGPCNEEVSKEEAAPAAQAVKPTEENSSAPLDKKE